MTVQFDQSTFELYNTTPTSIEIGMQAGTPFVSENLAPGIGVGMALTSIVPVLLSDEPFFDDNIAANSNSYLALADFTLPAGASLIQGTNNEDTYIDLGYGAILVFSCENLSFFVSGYDQYKQKVTYQINSALVAQSAPRAIRYISSIRAFNTTGSPEPLTITLSAMTFELPYYDFGRPEFLLGVTTPTQNDQVVPAEAQIWVDAQLTQPSDGVLTKLHVNTLCGDNPFEPELTATTGTVRTILTLQLPYTQIPSLAVQLIMIRQCVFGTSTQIPVGISTPVDDVDMVGSLVNNPIAVIGGAQYSTGWVGWKG